MLFRAVLALPFQVRQCSRSTSATITAFAATRAGRRRFQLNPGTLNKSLTGFQGMAAQGLRVLRDLQREHLRQQVSRCPIGQECGKMRLTPTQFRTGSTGNAMASRCRSRSRYMRHSESGEAIP